MEISEKETSAGRICGCAWKKYDNRGSDNEVESNVAYLFISEVELTECTPTFVKPRSSTRLPIRSVHIC
jgi:hypothetical protein